MTKTQSQSKNQTPSYQDEEPYKKFTNDGIPLRWYQTGAGISFIILLILTVVILVIAYIFYLKSSKKEGVQDSEIHETEVELEENPAYEINSETSPTLIDSILEKEEWEISADISVSDTSSQWRNLFHYGNDNQTRAPAMWIFLNQLWKLHFRIKTTRNANDGIDFFVPEQFQIEGEEFNVRIQYKEYDNTAKLSVYINDVFVKEQEIGVFTRVKNQQFNLKKGWEYTDKQDEYTDKENYTISNIKMKSEIHETEVELEENQAYEINSETSPTIIDSILEKEEWEISADISISDTSSEWRNLFHYGNDNQTRAPAMFIFPGNQLWKLHFRIKTTTSWNDGINFVVPEQFQIEGEEFNLRIQYKGDDNTSKLSVYINDVFVKEQEIGVFTPVKNQQFNVKKDETDIENYTISNIKMRSLI